MRLGNSSTGKTCNADMIFTTSSSVDAYFMDTLFAALAAMYSSDNEDVSATLGAANVSDSNASRWHTNNAFGKKIPSLFLLLASLSFASYSALPFSFKPLLLLLLLLLLFSVAFSSSSRAFDNTHSRAHLANNNEAVTPHSFELVGATTSALGNIPLFSSTSSSSSRKKTFVLFRNGGGEFGEFRRSSMSSSSKALFSFVCGVSGTASES
jgi:hypothetical protein